MWSDLRDNWRDPSFWHWWWREAVGRDVKIGLAVALALAMAAGGYLSAREISTATEAASVGGSVRVYTVKHTVVRRVVRVRGIPVTTAVTHEVRIPGRARTVLVTAPGSTIVRAVTIQQPGRDRTVTDALTQTVVRPLTTTRLVRGPTRTVVKQTPGPTQVVTQQVAGPTQTQTQVLTQTRQVTTTSPGRTVTSTATVTQPKTVTSTATVTETKTTTETRTTTETKTVTQPTTVTVTVTKTGP